MPAKLDIEYIEVRNFLSYGDYITRLDVANLGPVLILGKVEVDDPGSNGAGKSSLLTAFIWCLFGRTITNASPGDKVINWFTKKNCYVKIKTADGWEIIRTRNFDGHSELILRKHGDDVTQSTNTNAQARLKTIFGLDYGIFTSSVFCGQFGKSFLEMSTVKRKETIERLLGLDRLNKFADAAKVQFKQIENKQELTRTKIEILQTDSTRQESRVIENTKSKNQFEDNRKSKIDLIEVKLEALKSEISNIKIPDTDKLKKRWEVADSILLKVSEYKDKIKEHQLKVELLTSEISNSSNIDFAGFPYEVPNIDELKQKHDKADQARKHLTKVNDQLLDVRGQSHCLNQDIERYRKTIDDWECKLDTSCESCGQEIGSSHVEHSISSVKDSLGKLTKKREVALKSQNALSGTVEVLNTVEKPTMSVAEAQRMFDLNKTITEDIKASAEKNKTMGDEKEELLSKVGKIETIVTQTVFKLEQVKPKVTLAEVVRIKEIKESLNDRKSDFEGRVAEVISEVNPYAGIISDLLNVLADLKEEVEGLNDEVAQLDILFKHYKYIYRSYSDRRKIKSWLLSELIPFLNDRVQYYLDMLDIDMSIKFSSTLVAETDRWDYEFCSGGERKRIDLAIMFGLYDLYMSIYGQQCSIMVLDEVDSRLDKRGVESFTEIVHDICTNDERPRPSTIFVISHKQELESLFSSQIIIKKDAHFSRIDKTVFSSD